MWNGYGVWSNLALSGEPPPLLHKTNLTTEYLSVNRCFILFILGGYKRSTRALFVLLMYLPLLHIYCYLAVFYERINWLKVSTTIQRRRVVSQLFRSSFGPPCGCSDSDGGWGCQILLLTEWVKAFGRCMMSTRRSVTPPPPSTLSAADHRTITPNATAVGPLYRGVHTAEDLDCVGPSDRSVRFVKKTLGGGSPTGERVEAPQALTCNTNTGVRIDPQELKSTETRGQKNHWEGWTPPQPPGKSDPEWPWLTVSSKTLKTKLFYPKMLTPDQLGRKFHRFTMRTETGPSNFK